MNAKRLLEILQSFPTKDLEEITVVTMPTHSVLEVKAVIIDREGRTDSDFSTAKRQILFLNDHDKVMAGYNPEIFV